MAETTAIQQQQQQKPKPPALIDVIKSKQASFAEVATKYLSPERLTKLAIVAVTKTPDLAKVPPMEIVAELINCSRLGLEPNVEGGRWLLPFKRRDKDGGERWELVAVTDYRGLIDIARRSGEVLSIHADIVREADEDPTRGGIWEHWVDAGGSTLVHLRHRRARGERGAMLGVYAVVKLKNGEVQAEYLELEKVNAAKSRSRGADSKFSPWQNDFEAMAKKTAIRRLYNLLPKTPEISAAREVLAEEEAGDHGQVVETTATPVAPAASRTASVKAKLAAKAAPAQEAAEVPDDELGRRPLKVQDYTDQGHEEPEEDVA